MRPNLLHADIDRPLTDGIKRTTSTETQGKKPSHAGNKTTVDHLSCCEIRSRSDYKFV